MSDDLMRLNMDRFNHSNVAKFTAEFVGTFFLVLTIGCNVHTGSIGAALSIGSMLMVMIYALGSVSGAHFNPAVTLAVLLSGRGKIGPFSALLYMVFQILGGICGALLYYHIIGEAFFLQPVWSYTASDVVGVEIIYSWALCYVVLNVATTQAAEGNHYFGLAIGFTVVSAAIAIGSISGCSLNPAVSVGSYVAAHMKHGEPALAFWGLYVFAPFVGALIAWLCFVMVRFHEEYLGGFGFGSPSSGKGSAAETRPLMDPPPPLKREAAPPPPPPPPKPLEKPAPQPPATPSNDLDSKSKISVSMVTGQNLRLMKNLDNCDLFCGLKWEVGADSRGVDIDASCVKFDSKGVCLGAVYFADKEDLENGIRHSGDQVTGEAGFESSVDDEIISFRLQRIKPDVHFLFFVATIFSSGVHSFQDVSQCSARLVNIGAANQELCCFRKQNIGSGNALVVTMLFRGRDGHWHFEAIDKCYQIQEHGTYRALESQLARLCRQKKEIEGP